MTGHLTVPEGTVREAVGEVELPRMGVVERVWEADPIPTEKVEERATAAVDHISL